MQIRGILSRVGTVGIDIPAKRLKGQTNTKVIFILGWIIPSIMEAGPHMD
jgi:hypothetical protein